LKRKKNHGGNLYFFENASNSFMRAKGVSNYTLDLQVKLTAEIFHSKIILTLKA